MNLAMKTPPEGSVDGVRTAAANHPSQKRAKTRRMAAKNGSTFAKTPQFAKGGKENRFNLRKKSPKREG
ncbi:MAG: hypothetical protein MJY74_02120 [Bacteroidaceae bacterium]|nr:hypothetical protein [Bacteroidaceae bacterium]